MRFRKGEPVGWQVLRHAAITGAVLYGVSAIKAWIGRDWENFTGDAGFFAIAVATCFIVVGAASGVRLRLLALLAGFAAMFGIPAAAIGLPVLLTGSELSLDSSPFPGFGILVAFAAVAAFVAVTHVGPVHDRSTLPDARQVAGDAERG